MNCRIRQLQPSSLTDAQREIYDGIVVGKRAAGPQLFRLTDNDGCLNGPFNAFLLSPAIGAALSGVGEAIRFGCDIPPRIREIAILVVAEAYKSEFEWYAHEAIGRHVGLTQEVLVALHKGQKPDLELDSERTLYEFCIQVVRTQRVCDGLYEEAKAITGEGGILELVALLGYYITLALIMNVYQISVPEGANKAFDP